MSAIENEPSDVALFAERAEAHAQKVAGAILKLERMIARLDRGTEETLPLVGGRKEKILRAACTIWGNTLTENARRSAAAGEPGAEPQPLLSVGNVFSDQGINELLDAFERYELFRHRMQRKPAPAQRRAVRQW